MRLAAIAAWAALATLVGIGIAHADKRVALVVGNADYQHADKLDNPVTDARRMRDALTRLSFDVVFGENLDKRALERAVGRFANAAQDADVALVFFAGHGATFQDVPYVVPVDAQFQSLADMPYELFPVEMLVGELRRAKGLRIAILDACRDNAAERSLKRTLERGGDQTRGVARVKNPEGLIVAYATQYMATAKDGPTGGDSPFTAALLANIETPGLDVKDMLFRVGNEVIAKTGGTQRPEISVSFYDNYALLPASGGSASAIPHVAAPAPPVDPCAAAADHWRSAEAINTSAAYEDHVARFPTCPYVGLAQIQIARLKAGSQVAVVAPPVTPAVPTQSPARCNGTVLAAMSARAAKPLTDGEQCALQTKDVFRECVECPAMVVLPAGSFTMGSPADKYKSGMELPQHQVTIDKVAVGKFSVTVDEFAAFVKATGHQATGCYAIAIDGGSDGARSTWRRPGFPQSGLHPAVCISWDDATAYVAWLSKRTGKTYRLLTEAEWEYAARAGSTAEYAFGDDEKEVCRYGNGRDAAVRKVDPKTQAYACNDGFAYTAPSGSFPPNAFGLYDMIGNAKQWVQDCATTNYQGVPTDGTAVAISPCEQRIQRGGSWRSHDWLLRSASREYFFARSRFNDFGLRVARELVPRPVHPVVPVL